MQSNKLFFIATNETDRTVNHSIFRTKRLLRKMPEQVPTFESIPLTAQVPKAKNKCARKSWTPLIDGKFVEGSTIEAKRKDLSST